MPRGSWGKTPPETAGHGCATARATNFQPPSTRWARDQQGNPQATEQQEVEKQEAWGTAPRAHPQTPIPKLPKPHHGGETAARPAPASPTRELYSCAVQSPEPRRGGKPGASTLSYSGQAAEGSRRVRFPQRTRPPVAHKSITTLLGTTARTRPRLFQSLGTGVCLFYLICVHF